LNPTGDPIFTTDDKIWTGEDSSKRKGEGGPKKKEKDSGRGGGIIQILEYRTTEKKS